MGRASDRRQVTRIDLGGPSTVRRQDTLAAEEPLEIRVGHRRGPRPPLAVTMRTPGDELDLALGFLLTEGVITSPHDILTAQLCAGASERKGTFTSEYVEEGHLLNIGRAGAAAGEAVAAGLRTAGRMLGGSAAGEDAAPAAPANTYNVVDVVLADHVPPPATGTERNFYTTSSCGVCGKASIDAIRTRSPHDVAADPVTVDARTLSLLPDRLRAAQRTFERTGGLHAAGLFTPAGELVTIREDVGRHNAVDKLIGAQLQAGRLPLAGHVLLVSGRASFELTQKAWMAGISVMAAVSAPSTLAVDLAAEAGMTLVGFLRGQTMNVYAGPHRVTT
ncbi:formate dehydrogenase accessory sulfurtransferase FdhD [Catellatospora citrea]|uniref:Sulfur carrier protein FdhD n=1 Tax=Catellatospora citrea TaxID=53366 RepID=A0A8J3KJM6_9ACTN|nr:formate dehydrogenase accessory sulfurtransferase FdhD [Catellatospora citrea]RKE07872.1 FdhD protein [Catellatospora citrea]GIG02120.1 sulfurtransferase FdhD [Catellatospora citrea]